jgi:hypothetical protein
VVILTDKDDERVLEEWLVLRIAEQRIQRRVLIDLIARKRGRLRFASGLLALQVGYVFLVIIAVALMWPQSK